MGTKELRKRETWQDDSGPKAEAAENKFYDVFLREFLFQDNNLPICKIQHFTIKE